MTPEEMLKALAEEDRDVQAPPMVEAKLRAAFREKHQVSTRSRRWLWIPLAAAAIAAVVMIAIMNRPKPAVVVVKQDQPVRREPVAPVVVAASQSAQKIARPAAHRRAAAPREVMTDFFPLMADAPAISDGAEMVRVNLPASAMREVGLPVREDRLNDRVQADVLVNYGMATAVRFVSYQK